MAEGVVWLPSLCGQGDRRYAFWDNALTLNTSTPDLTVCFQKTVLLWVPCGWLWACALLYHLPHLYTRPTRHAVCTASWLNLLKTVSCSVLCVTTLLCLGLQLGAPERHPVDDMQGIVSFCTMVLAAVITRAEYMKGVHSSGVSSVFWLLQFLCDVIILRSWVLRSQREVHQFTTFAVYFSFVCCMFVLSTFSDKQALKPRESDETKEDIPLLDPTGGEKGDQLKDEKINVNDEKTLPELYTPFWLKITFLWITSTVIRGYKRPLRFDSLYRLHPSEKCCNLVPRFYQCFNQSKSDQELPLRDEAGKRQIRASFLWALFRSGAFLIVPSFLLHLCGQTLRTCQALILGLLIREIEQEDPYQWKGVLLSLILFLAGVFASISFNYSNHLAWVAGMHVRTTTCAVVYRKALRLSRDGHVEATEGKILNFMSIDAQKVKDLFIWAPLVLKFVFEVVLCTTMLWQVIGKSALAGVVVLFIIVPINGFYSAHWLKKLQAKQMAQKDIRIKLMSQVLSGIKIIKLYAWEPPFLEKIQSTRTRELAAIRAANLIGAMTTAMWTLVPYLMSLAIFTTFVLLSSSSVLTPYIAFVTLSLVNTVTEATMLPVAVSCIVQGIVSVHRITKFLGADELEDNQREPAKDNSDAILLENGCFSWERASTSFLKSINLRIPRGQLVAVVGTVGSGKSSLMSAIQGEMSRQQGFIQVNGSFAYVPQRAWIRNASLRENVLYGKCHQTARYNATLDACALFPDLEQLPDGDLTEIGEKGINLSGGQKQRVSLARAVYQDEDIYLLDDPLSAVDTHVGKHIFNKVISNQGLLKDKTRICVTHHLNILPDFDVVVVMSNGKISEIGSYNELVKQKGNFAEYLKSYLAEPADKCSEKEWQQDSRNASNPRLQIQVYRKEVQNFDKSEIMPLKLIQEETPGEGKIGAALIWRYLTAAGLTKALLALLFVILYTIAQTGTNYWLCIWATNNQTSNIMFSNEGPIFHLIVYGALGIFQTIFTFLLFIVCAMGCVSASHVLHREMLQRVMRAPMAFFDCTPLGRILNRFAKDTDSIDNDMFYSGSRFILRSGLQLATLIVISFTTPIFIVPIIPIIAIWVFIQHLYIRCARQLKRIDSIRQSPLYTQFDETLQGASSIRAYQRQSEFINKCDGLIDESQQASYLISVVQRWLGIIMESLGSVIVLFAALFAVLSGDSLPPGMAALSVSYALNMTSMLNFQVRDMTRLETKMVSIERVNEYCQVDQEADWDVSSTAIDDEWPQKGRIVLDGYGTRYRPGLDLVLQNLNFDIKAGEKIGIVGRTGAGKSSLALALMRLVEGAQGSISVDGVPIYKLGLHTLRSRLTVIPQEAFIFSGSLRYNLDPFSRYSDPELWQALEQAHFKETVLSLPDGLQHDLCQGGQSLSAGQRKLVCLARAILRKTKVLILDEATASVDLETDALIQSTIREVFSDCTVLAIAHRLSTIMDYDRVMVIDGGRVIELDDPRTLLAQPSSVFHNLAKESGII